jgi:hypothetical protein
MHLNVKDKHYLREVDISPKVRITKIQFTDHRKLKKKDNQSVDASVLLRRGNKMLTGGNMETSKEQRLKERPSKDFPTWGSIPYIVAKPGCYCGCWEVLVDRSLICVSPDRLCQNLTNTEADARSQPLE